MSSNGKEILLRVQLIAAAVFFGGLGFLCLLGSNLDPYGQGMLVGIVFFALAVLIPLSATAEARRMNDDDSPPSWRPQGAIVLDAPAQPAPPASLAAVLRAIPGAVILPPQGGDSKGVIVATLDENFVARVRAAVRGAMHCGEIILIAGEAPPDPRFDPHRRGRYLWSECWRNGVLRGPEPRRRHDIADLRGSRPDYWIVGPANERADLALRLDASPVVLPARRPACVVRAQEEA